jgi:GNAT superfamily N-acetyltransferase
MPPAPLDVASQPAIRSAHSADLPWLYEVCRATVDLRQHPQVTHADLDPYLVGQLYVAPYIAFEPAASAVLTLEARVQGYAVGTSDSKAFEAFLSDTWLPRVREQYPRDLPHLIPRDQAFLQAIHALRPQLPAWIERYPAHLHADLLPSSQGRGFGRKLVGHFLDYLRQAGCPGAHVDVARNNPSAIAFYRALGLTTLLEETANGVVLGLELSG